MAILTVVKIAIAVGILAYLIVQARHAIGTLAERTVDWRFSNRGAHLLTHHRDA